MTVEFEFTTRAIRRHVARRALRRRGNAAWLAGAGLGAVAAGVTGAAAPWLVVLAGVAGAMLNAGYQYWGRRAQHVLEHVASVEAARDRARMARLGELRARLFDLAEHGPHGELASTALVHYQRLRQHHEAFGQLLARKLNAGELTYVRFAAAVDAAYAVAVANLTEIADRLQAKPADSVAADLRGVLSSTAAAIDSLADTADAVARLRDLDAVPDAGQLDTVIERLESLAALAGRIARG